MSLSLPRIGELIRDIRIDRGLTQADLGKALSTSQSTIGRIESGHQNLSLETIGRIEEVLGRSLITVAAGSMDYEIQGGHQLHGTIETRSSKNAAVALMCAALLNRGTTTLRGIAHIEEVKRIVEVLQSIGVTCAWSRNHADITLTPPETLHLDGLDQEAARLTRSILLLLGPLIHHATSFTLPYSGGCNLGTRTVEPHVQALRHFGLSVIATDGVYHCDVAAPSTTHRSVTLIERGDTVTENAIMAAALTPGTTVIRNASPNYMVQDLCAFLAKLGVTIDGVGMTTLTVTGVDGIDKNVDYDISEDPIEAMSLLTAGIVTDAELTITRVPIEFLEVELTILASMGLDFTLTPEYVSRNGLTRLTDLTVHPSSLTAPVDKIHPMPFPGLNIDNLPMFVVIAACSTGQTMIFDWVYDNRMIHMLDLTRMGAEVRLLDPYRLMVTGPTRWRGGSQIICPSALRPAVCLLLAALGADGAPTTLRETYSIARGYELLSQRLNHIGADIHLSAR